MTPKRVVMRGLSAAVVIIAVVLFVYMKTEPAPPETLGGPIAQVNPQGAEPAAEEIPPNLHPAPSAATARLAPSAEKRLIDEQTRAIMLAKILSRINGSSSARASEGLPSPESASGGLPSEASAKEGSLPREYIQQQVREIVPLVKECYEMALEKSPDLGGDLKVQFTIVGDEEYGGLVEDSKILDGSSLATNADITECVRETMYAIRLKAPEGGGRVVVTYPFIFSSER